MDQVITQYYRRLLREDFPNAGELVNPTVFIEAVGGEMINCGNIGNYIQLYLQVIDDRITEITYICVCEPAANVAVEVLCDLARGKTLAEAENLQEESFYQIIGSRAEDLHLKVEGLLKLLKDGIDKYQTRTGSHVSLKKHSDKGDGQFNWDGTQEGK